MIGQLAKRVLLVDDEPLIRKLISGYLVAAGYVVQTAVDGLDALGKLRAGLPDLIISDLNMPRMSGLEFLKVVRERFPQIPVLVISSEPADALPVGLASDAHYQKTGFGFQNLLESISDLTQLPHRTARPVDNEQVRARRNENDHYVIDCKDCLREFSAPRTFHLGQPDQCAICVHCGKIAQFAAEHPSPPSVS